MLNTSLDLLYVVLAFCALWFTLFLSWWLFYLAQLTKNVNNLVEETHEKVRMLFEAVDFIKDKLGMVTTAIGFLTEHFLNKQDAPKKSSSKKRK
jgi:uncharacterized membrane protein